MAVYFRVDDRLIHGQVITSWSRYYNFDEIYIVDDQVAIDPIQRKIISMVAPERVTIYVIDIKSAISDLEDVNNNALVLVKNPNILLQLIDNGIHIEEIIVGGLQYKGGKQKISKSVSLDENEISDFRNLLDKGINVYIQMIPSEKRRNLKNLLQKGK